MPTKKSRRLLKKLPKIIAEKLNNRASEDSRPVLLFAQDEGRFGRISDVRRAWSPVGIRPHAPRQIIRKYLCVFTAVCPALGKMTSLILPWANTGMMNIFLRQVAEDFSDYFILMLVDQAGWHIAQKLQLPENIRLIKLPLRSPELNPSEHIWEEIREKNFANRAFRDLDEVEDTFCQGLNDLAKDPEKLCSMTNFPYLNITCYMATWYKCCSFLGNPLKASQKTSALASSIIIATSSIPSCAHAKLYSASCQFLSRFLSCSPFRLFSRHSSYPCWPPTLPYPRDHPSPPGAPSGRIGNTCAGGKNRVK
jgi:hypothetical protein